MRAVLDTNVVMSAIFFGGVPFGVLSAWHNGEFELVVSDAVMEEYREIAARMKAKSWDGMKEWLGIPLVFDAK